MRTERFTTRASEAIENPLAKKLLAGAFAAGDTVRIDVREGSLVFDKVAAEPVPEPVTA